MPPNNLDDKMKLDGGGTAMEKSTLTFFVNGESPVCLVIVKARLFAFLCLCRGQTWGNWNK